MSEGGLESSDRNGTEKLELWLEFLAASGRSRCERDPLTVVLLGDSGAKDNFRRMSELQSSFREAVVFL
jgi:hypothetical protein